MPKVVMACVDNNIFLRALVSEGRMLQFGIGGKYVGEFPISFDLTYVEEVDVVSLLSNNGHIEVGVNCNEVFTKFETGRDLATLNMLCNGLKGLEAPFRRQVKTDGILYTQYIYVYKKGSIRMPNIKTLLS
jgi:hypothetical protein